MIQNVWYLLVVTFLLALLQFGCSSNSSPDSGSGPSQGIEVGNGRKGYYFSQAFQFKVSFPNSLTLKATSETEFELSNDDLLESSQTRSFIRFQIYPGARIHDTLISGQMDLANYVRRVHQNPYLQFQPQLLSRARGLSWSERDSTSSKGILYLLTPRGDLLVINYQASENAQGTKIIESVLDSFVYDDVPPQLLDATIDTGYLSKTITRVNLKASDDNSGLAEKVTVVLIPSEMSMDVDYPELFELSVPLVPTGGNGYRIDIPKPRRYPGTYVIHKITLFDRNANQLSYVALQMAKEPMALNEQEVAWEKPALVFEVSDKEDPSDASPEIQNLQLNSEHIVVDTTATLKLQIVEPASNPNAHYRVWMEIRKESEPESALKGGLFYSDVWPLGDRWFAVGFVVPAAFAEGKYFFHSITVDNQTTGQRTVLMATPGNGNYFTSAALLPVLRFDLKASQDDKAPPQVSQLELIPSQWAPGQRAKLRFHVTDNYSGLPDRKHLIGKLVPVHQTGTEPRLVIPVSGQIKVLGDDWYEVSFLAPPNARAGEYYLGSFVIADRSGNETRYKVPLEFATQPSLPGDAHLVNERTKEKLPVPRLTLLPAENR